MKPVFISCIKICSFVLLMFVDFAMSAKPMESILDYNVILVHGAADSHQGLDCENGDDKDWEYTESKDNLDSLTGYSIRIGSRDGNSPATGMIKGLNICLNLNVITREGRV